MAAVNWTIKIGSSAPVTFDSLGLSGITRTCRSGMEDVVTIRHDGHPIDYDPAIGYGANVTIYRDGVKWFYGRCNTMPVAGDGNAEGHTYEIVGPWWWLEQIVYQQDWKLWDPSAGALVTKKKSRVILFQQADGTVIDSGAQVEDTLDYAIALGAPITRGTIELAVNLPMEEVLDISCAEVIRRCMRWSPEFVAWFDYTTATPTLHIRAPSSLGTLSYNCVTDDARQSIQIRPRYDLQVPGVTIHYERTNTVDGVGYETFEEDTAGTTTDPRSVVATIELAGSNTNYLRQRIETEDWPTSLNDKTWWKAHHPALAETLDADLTITDAKIQETGGAPSGLYPRILLEGQLQDWMDVEYTTYNVVATVAVVKKVGAAIVKQEKNQQLSFTIVATDAETKTYTGLADSESAEDTPTGLAAKFYASWGRLHYEGTWGMVSEDVPAGTLMGNIINLTGGAAAWAAMAAVVYEVFQDVDNGTTQVRFGPNRYLGLNDLVALLRTLRHRRTSIRHKARETGEAADKAGGGMDNAGPVAKNDADTGYSEVLSQYMTSDEYGESTVRKIELAPNDIDDTTGEAALTVKSREVGILDPSTLAFKKRQVLCSEAYGSALGTVSSAIDVITAVQYDTSSHELQYKKRSVKVIDAGSESSWTTFHTAAPCPS